MSCGTQLYGGQETRPMANGDLNEAMEIQQEMIKDVRRIYNRTRIQGAIICVLIVLLVCVVVVAVQNRRNDTRLREQNVELTRQAETLAHTVEEHAALVVSEEIDDARDDRIACQVFNHGNEQVRVTFEGIFEVLAKRGLSPQALREMRREVAPAKQTDVDCNGDNELTHQDYQHPRDS